MNSSGKKTVPGKPPTARAIALEGLVKLRGWQCGAELGVLRGAVFMHLMNSCRSFRLIGVDTWTPAPEKEAHREEGGRGYTGHDLETYYADLRKLIKPFGARAKLWRMTTLEAAGHVNDASLDFVFIDACHMEDSVRADIQAWAPKVRPGGSICGHDINWPSVHRAVIDTLGGFYRYRCNIWEHKTGALAE